MVLVLLPHQLFEEVIDREPEKVYLVEHSRFFTDFSFNKKKLMLHRASMKAFEERLEQKGIESEYIEFDAGFEEFFHGKDFEIYNPVDRKVEAQLESLESDGADIDFLNTPMFLRSDEWNQAFFKKNDYFQQKYYKKQRKDLDILMDVDSPEGGKWSFDQDNRKKLPEDVETPDIPRFSNKYVEEAKKYVKENFGDNPGSVDGFSFATTHKEARNNLENFLEQRLDNFGPYQDAIDKRITTGFHSLISSSINIGLLTPEEVVESVETFYEGNDVKIQSVEGFIRQIIGWREYIRALYVLEGDNMRSSNFFGCENKLPESFYRGDTGIEPVDVSIKNSIENSYAHHIERLMVLGNIMLLLEIAPDEVYRWFMEMFIDSYDWVMVPNVYGMSQYAFSEMMTKPYISSSNYINNMSHYKSGKWEDYWDGLYWNFINNHKKKISNINRMSFMSSTLERMGEETVSNHLKNAEEFRKNLE